MTASGAPAILACAEISPQRSAMSRFTSRIRPTKRNTRSLANQLSSRARLLLRGSESMPLRISPIVSTLKWSNSSLEACIHEITFASGRTLVSSEITFVSRRYPLTDQFPCHNHVADQAPDLPLPAGTWQKTRPGSLAVSIEPSSVEILPLPQLQPHLCPAG